MAFMERQITKKLKWIEIDGGFGTTWVPAVDVPEVVAAVEQFGSESAEAKEAAADYYEGSADRIESVSLCEGYGARLSAPGYMDCTEWSVFETEAEAEKDLEENYPDDEEDGTDAEED